MTNDEKIKAAEGMISQANEMIMEANKLIAEVKASKQSDDVISEYIDAFGIGVPIWYIAPYGGISECFSNKRYEELSTEEHEYLNDFWREDYAKESLRLASFNNKLLAFKWCWDRDYVPDWSRPHEDKFYVYYNHNNNLYYVAHSSVLVNNVVYFSSKEIAQKCCDWLNSEEECESI